MSRYFTLDEAQSLIPEIEALIDTILASKLDADRANSELQQLNSRINMMGGRVKFYGSEAARKLPVWR
jgi:hypothetical protein